MSTSTQQTWPDAGKDGELRRRAAGGEALGRRVGGQVPPSVPDRNKRLARGLGWFSLGLGIVQLTAPRALVRVIGVRDDRGSRSVTRAVGVREIAAGIGILTQPQHGGWLWARVGGDLTDLGLMGSAFSAKRAKRGRIAVATASLVGVTILDALAGRRLIGGAAAATPRARRERRREVVKAITVNRSPEDVYRFWRDFRNLPSFMARLASVKVLDDRRSRWSVSGPAGRRMEWSVEITEDRPGERIAWRTLRDAGPLGSGSVYFTRAPGERGTEVRVEMLPARRGGVIAATLAKLFGKMAANQVASDLHRFKQVMETGEVARSDASVRRGPHPAQPPAAPMRPPRREAALGQTRMVQPTWPASAGGGSQ
ncbi:Hypothetical protein A7982_03948 [Minicystis rosea]|nr:Hypothetical protein A7982_03948 [Minicystis rosea]